MDTAGVYTGGYDTAGTHYHHNWVHDMTEKCMRGDDLSLNMTVHHNVLYNCGEPNGDKRRDGVGLVSGRPVCVCVRERRKIELTV